MVSRIKKINQIPKAPELVFKPKIVRVAAYARVSTNDADQLNSLVAQVDYYSKKVQETPEWVLMEVYADEGKTGTSYFQRKEFLRMIEDCKLGKIDMIITKSISRFARNTVDALKYIRLLKEMDIGVQFEREDIWTLDSKGEFLITLLTSLAQEEARAISENTAWGIRKRFADGKYSVGYSHFLGYDRGRNKDEFVINEEQALIVRLIYRMYLQQYYVHEGHEAIIDAMAFDYTQTLITTRYLSGREKYSGITPASSFLRCGVCGAWYGPKPEHSNDKYRKVVMMCHNRFKKPLYCKNSRILKSEIPNIYMEIARRIYKKYPQIRKVLQSIFLNLGVKIDVKLKKSYIKDIRDISIVVSSATVFPNEIIKIELIDKSQMKIKL